jgi:hypothetical protein
MIQILPIPILLLRRNNIAMSKNTTNNFEIPFQVQSLIDTLRNKKEYTHVRSNYRMRLGGIRSAIDAALNDFDNEMILKKGEHGPTPSKDVKK